MVASAQPRAQQPNVGFAARSRSCDFLQESVSRAIARLGDRLRTVLKPHCRGDCFEVAALKQKSESCAYFAKYIVPRFWPFVLMAFAANSFCTGSLSSLLETPRPLEICSRRWPSFFLM